MSYTDLMSGFLIVFIIISLIFQSRIVPRDRVLPEGAVPLDTTRFESVPKGYIAGLRNQLDSLQKKNISLVNVINEFEDILPVTDMVDREIDTNRGSIVLRGQNGRVLFQDFNDVSNGQMMEDPMPVLRDYLRSYGKDLVRKTMELSDKYGRDIELRIEGHTDPNYRNGRGTNESFLWNLDLSSKRAEKVYEVIFKMLDPQEQLFAKKHMISVGYSFSSRLDDLNDSDLDGRSRRIEFRIIIK